MNRVRRGKDFKVLWSFFDFNGEPYQLDKTFLTLYVSNSFDRFEVTDFSVEENTITWIFRGKDQKALGDYTLELIQNNGTEGMIPIDSVDAFTLVQYSRDESLCGGGNVKIEDVTVNSTLDIETISSLIDAQLSEISVNPVQNKVITAALNNKADKSSVPTKTSQLTNDSGFITAKEAPAPDWNASIYKEGHIKNRTHHMQDYMCHYFNGSPIKISKPSDVGYVLLTYDTDLPEKFIRIEINANESKTYEFLDAMGMSLIFTWDAGNSTINVESFTGAVETYGMRAYYSSSAKSYDEYFVKLDKGFIPEGAMSQRSMVSITYAELVELRDNGELIAGMQYRITDYVTTTAQENTRSAGYQFDVIVTADNENTLNEVARACLHEGDTYFSEAGANLAAWQIWYSLDNDAERFVWADTANGKGVIYRMIDEFNNDLPYDFKNIMFVRYELEAPEEYIAEGNDTLWMQQLCNNVRAKFDEGVRSFVWAGIADEDKYWEDDVSQILSHTTGENFAFFTFNTDEDTDASLSGNIHGNKMQLSQALPNNVFFGNDCNSNSFGNNCYSNSFGNDCYSNSFGNNCNYNSFGNDCNSNSFGNSCDSNSFGNNCNYNSFGNDCYYNSFGNSCYYNSFGNNCNYNSFGNSCYYNSFGNDCNSNSFGNDCYSNSFGNNCYSNSFGNDCYSNSFGNNCYSNSFGNDCYYNSFGNDSQSNELKAYYRYITFGEGVHYVTLQNNTEGGYENLVQNYRVANGTHGEDGNPIVVDVTRNMGCETFIGMDSNDELKVFCLADLLN